MNRIMIFFPRKKIKEELKKKYKEIKRLYKHNQYLNDAKNMIKCIQELKSKNKDEDTIRTIEDITNQRLEEEICKKVEESLNIDEIKSEMQFSIEERCKNLINGIIL
jgi:hypothetical protein